MKRTSEKESSPSFKKTKTEHGESSQPTLDLPTKSIYENREPKKNLIASMIKPKPVPEPIVLSSDDEDDIIMQKNVLAESLNDTKTNAISTSQKEDITIPKVDETKLNILNAAAGRASVTPIPETVASAMDISNLDDDEDGNDASVDVNASSPPATTSFVDDMSEVDELRSDTEIDEVDESEKDKKVDETEEEKKVDGVAQVTSSTSAINNDENKDAMEVSDDNMEVSEDNIKVSSDITENTKKTEESETVEVITEAMEISDNATKINAVETISVRDENDIVDIESMDVSDDNMETSEGNIEPDNKVEHVNNTSVRIATTSGNRPVREHASKVKTYNDIANSIDPTKLNYVSSDSDDDSKPPTIILARKPTKPRASPTKTMRPGVILSKFTKELTSRRRLKTGFVYDTAMSYHATPNPMEIHPEDPRRIFKIFNILEQHGLLRECERIASRRATKQEILLVHNIIHYRKLRDTADLKKRSDYMAMENDYDSIYLNSNSFESALYAVGSLINLMEAVINDTVKNAFAIIRPPGHHAEADMPMGFCLFNNVAVATRSCQKKLGVKKVLIVDWDVHFGNGTQVIFSEDPDVLYVSLHRFEDALFYPSDNKGSASYTGYGKGVGKTVNVPWPCPGMTDADYIYAFREVIMPIAMEYNPDVVVVSAGFDAAINDPIGKCNVTPAGYGQMTHMLKSIARGKLVIALEGGYDLNSIAVSALACMNVLLGDSPEPIDPNLKPKKECIETIIQVKKVQQKYWNCLSEVY
ncbi:hypothetical protein HPULCUR_011113 [Helicostylum pulchrum]|uniref:histone deacetylase n=1 Tax=Helicostylum pulchrum TaxID=562976 RepID=A0ABP9YF57_9FUNG